MQQSESIPSPTDTDDHPTGHAIAHNAVECKQPTPSSSRTVSRPVTPEPLPASALPSFPSTTPVDSAVVVAETKPTGIIPTPAQSEQPHSNLIKPIVPIPTEPTSQVEAPATSHQLASITSPEPDRPKPSEDPVPNRELIILRSQLLHLQQQNEWLHQQIAQLVATTPSIITSPAALPSQHDAVIEQQLRTIDDLQEQLTTLKQRSELEIQGLRLKEKRRDEEEMQLRAQLDERTATATVATTQCDELRAQLSHLQSVLDATQQRADQFEQQSATFKRQIDEREALLQNRAASSLLQAKTDHVRRSMEMSRRGSALNMREDTSGAASTSATPPIPAFINDSQDLSAEYARRRKLIEESWKPTKSVTRQWLLGEQFKFLQLTMEIEQVRREQEQLLLLQQDAQSQLAMVADELDEVRTERNHWKQLAKSSQDELKKWLDDHQVDLRLLRMPEPRQRVILERRSQMLKSPQQQPSTSTLTQSQSRPISQQPSTAAVSQSKPVTSQNRPSNADLPFGVGPVVSLLSRVSNKSQPVTQSAPEAPSSVQAPAATAAASTVNRAPVPQSPKPKPPPAALAPRAPASPQLPSSSAAGASDRRRSGVVVVPVQETTTSLSSFLDQPTPQQVQPPVPRSPAVNTPQRPQAPPSVATNTPNKPRPPAPATPQRLQQSAPSPVASAAPSTPQPRPAVAAETPTEKKRSSLGGLFSNFLNKDKK